MFGDSREGVSWRKPYGHEPDPARREFRFGRLHLDQVLLTGQSPAMADENGEPATRQSGQIRRLTSADIDQHEPFERDVNRG